jgi:hypothetical protein
MQHLLSVKQRPLRPPLRFRLLRPLQQRLPQQARLAAPQRQRALVPQRFQRHHSLSVARLLLA